jgi:hypothetical protein
MRQWTAIYARIGQISVAVGALTACSSGPVEGTLVDVLAGKPLTPGAPLELVADAEGTGARLTCQKVVSSVAPDGSFALDGLCGDTDYRLRLTDGALWLAEADRVAAGATGPLTLDVWRSPNDVGVFELTSEGAVVGLGAEASLKEVVVFDTDQRLRCPDALPSRVPSIEAGEFLVLSGADYVAKTMEPLLPSGSRLFGSAEDPTAMSPWYYIGVLLTSDTEYEPRTVAIDDSKVVRQAKGERTLAWIPHDAVPEGTYAIMDTATNRRMFIVKFGAAPVPELPEAAAFVTMPPKKR